jgi:dihydrofolate reductase
MGKVVVDLTVSLDGFIAGSDDGPDLPLGAESACSRGWAPGRNRIASSIERALELAQEAAGALAVSVSAADVAQQLLRAGKLDEIQVSVVPLLLGGGVRLFDHLGPDPIALEQIRVIESEGVTHLRYRVVRG